MIHTLPKIAFNLPQICKKVILIISAQIADPGYSPLNAIVSATMIAQGGIPIAEAVFLFGQPQFILKDNAGWRFR